MTVALRPLSEADIPVTEAILRDGFGADRVFGPALRRYLALQTDGWLLAVLDGVPVAVGGALRYPGFAWLGNMVVRSEYRGRGIAGVLLRAILEDLEGRGLTTVALDATPLGYPLYRRFGFVEVDEVPLFARPARLAATARPPEIAPFTLPDLDEVAAFDAPIFGGSRSRVLARSLQEHPGRGFVLRDGGHVAGYLIAQQQRIGPWVARDAATAELLLRAALGLPYRSEPHVLAPRCNTDAARLLADHGFVELRFNRFMVRGRFTREPQRRRIYGQSSFAIG